MTTASVGRKARSTTAARTGMPENIASRPASQSATSAASRPPFGVGSPDQTCPAVNKKPAMMATAKPNTIS